MSPPVRGSETPREDHASTRSLLIKGAFSFVGGLVAGVLGLVLVVLVSRAYGAQGAGEFFTATAVVLVLVNICKLGADTGLIWILPRLRATDRAGQQSRTIWTALAPVWVVASLAAVGLVLSSGQLAEALSGGVALQDSLRLGSLAVIFGTCATALVAATRGLGMLAPYIGLQNIVLPGLRALAVATVAFFGASVVGAVAAWVAAWVAVALAALAVILVRLSSAQGSTDPAKDSGGATIQATIQSSITREFWRFSIPRGAAAAVEICLVWSDVIIVSYLLGPAEAGVYAVVSRFVTSGALGESALRIALAPRFSALFSIGDTRGAQTLFGAATPTMVLLTWPVFVIAIMFAPTVLAAFGSDFTSGALTLIILSLAMLLVSVLGPVQPVLLMSGRSSLQLLNKSAALTVMVSLNLVLVPMWGIVGAGVAWGLALAVDNGLAASQVRARFGVKAPVSVTFSAAVGVLLSFGSAWALGVLLGLPSVPHLFLTGVLGTLILMVYVWRRLLSRLAIKVEGARP